MNIERKTYQLNKLNVMNENRKEYWQRYQQNTWKMQLIELCCNSILSLVDKTELNWLRTENKLIRSLV